MALNPTTSAGMAEALLHRMSPRTPMTDNGRQFRGMTLIEMARESLQADGINVRGMDRMSVATQALQYRGMGTSDFPSILANVAEKRLRQAYTQSPASYKLWTRQAPSLQDFRPVTVAQLSGAPDLLRTNEAGEFKFGAMSDGAETYALLTYGRIIGLTRQAMVNDDLRAFDTALAGFAAAAVRLENRLVYAQLTGNAALADGIPLFDPAHKNLGTGAGSALQTGSLKAMRSAMRQQVGLQSEVLDLSPSYLIVPSSLEQDAYQLTSANYVPAKPGDVNEFRQGGRTSLEPVIEPLLDGVNPATWYAAANYGQVDTIEYAYLEGAEGPVIETQNSFEVDGMGIKCRLDFAAKAIDYRGLFKGAGA
jgi:hypothetical protein